jgi:hypothetical protein
LPTNGTWPTLVNTTDTTLGGPRVCAAVLYAAMVCAEHAENDASNLWWNQYKEAISGAIDNDKQILGAAVTADTFADLIARISDAAGLGRTPSPTNLVRVKEWINDGYREFLGGLDPRSQNVYQWSFLQPQASLHVWPDVAVSSVTATGVYSGGVTTVTASSASFFASMERKTLTVTGEGTMTIAGYTSTTVVTVAGDHHWTGSKTFSIASDHKYVLPADFGSIVDDFVYGETAQSMLTRIMARPVMFLREKIAMNLESSMPPRFYALQTNRPADAGSLARSEILVFPSPDSEYLLYYRYRVRAIPLADLTDYPLGGPEHFGTIMAAAMAAAENDPRGPRAAQFASRMSASIDLDTQNKQLNLGPTRSSDSGMDRPLTHWDSTVTTSYPGVI